MGSFGGRRWWGSAALVVVAACSGSDDAPDVAEALDGADLTEATSALFGDEAAPPADADLAERAALTADRIAASLEAFDGPLDDGEFAARYEEALGAGPADQMRRVGAVLGHTRAALAGADGDDAMAYALRLGWDLADRLADPADRLDWVLLDPDRLDATERDELTARLRDGDDGEAAELVRDTEGGLAAADVIDSTLSEVSELVPADVAIDALGSLLTSYGVAAGPEES